MRKVLSIMIILSMAISFNGCQQTSHSKLQGMWIADNHDYEYNYFGVVRNYTILNFVNKNTVLVYEKVFKQNIYDEIYGNIDDLSDWTLPNQLPNHSGYYYYQDECKTYTYAIEDNKVFISNGMILTIISSTTLLQDGSSCSFSPFE